MLAKKGKIEPDRCNKCIRELQQALKQARMYWYGLQLNARQAVLFQKGIDTLLQAVEAIKKPPA